MPDQFLRIAGQNPYRVIPFLVWVSCIWFGCGDVERRWKLRTSNESADQITRSLNGEWAVFIVCNVHGEEPHASQ